VITVAVDFRALYLQKYPAGGTTLYVSASGNDSNPGTQASPKRQIQSAINAMPSGGGIIYVGDGNYDGFSFYARNFSANSWCHVISQNYLGAKIGGGIGFTQSSFAGIFGLEVNPNNQGVNCVSIQTTTHNIAVWRCWTRNGQVGIGAMGNQGDSSAACNNVYICYNIVSDNAKATVDPFGSSGISFYDPWQKAIFPASTGPDQYGYSNYIVGNLVVWNYQNGEYVDGNGIIIDDGNHTQNYGGPSGNVYTERTLVMGNLTVKNGGRGIQIFETRNVDVAFNTSAYNSWRKNDSAFYGEIGYNAAWGGRMLHNLSYPDANNAYWFSYYNADDIENTGNVFLRGPQYNANGNYPAIDRTADGLNYFKNNAPTVSSEWSGMTFTQADQWRPDGGSGGINKVTLSQTLYDAFSPWPDMFGDLRPARTTGWATGFSESTGGTGTNPGPVAAFTVSNLTPGTGEAVQFTDTSTGSPTSWNWNFGNGASSTSQSPSYTFTTAGTYTVVLTATNTNGSSQSTQSVVVSETTQGPGLVTHPALGKPGHLLTSTQVSTTNSGHPIYRISYQMTSITGTIVSASGLVAVPSGTAPSDGRRVILAGHGATGTNDAAAPSYSPNTGAFSGSVGDVDAWLNAGFIVAQADYEGLTYGGDSSLPHPYMVGVSAGRSLLDCGIACSGLTTVRRSAASVGFSQGGHASLFAGELADTYAVTDSGSVEFNVPAFPSGTPINVTTLGVSASSGANQQTAIQNALNNAASGSIIQFPAGTYLHSGVLQINKPLTIFTTAGAILRGTDPLNMAIQVNADDVRIEGFTVEGVGTSRESNDDTRGGIAILGRARTVIKGCTIKKSSAAGLYIDGASDYYIINNSVQNTLSDSIHNTGSSHHGYVLNNTVTGSGDDNIAIVSYGGQDCNNITVFGNTVTGGNARGLSVVGGRDCILQGNTVTSSSAAGIYIASEPSYSTEGVSNIIIRDNALSGCNTDVARNHGGIFLWGGRPGKPVNNVHIHNNTISGTIAGGAHMVVQGDQVTATTMTNNATSGAKQHRYIEAAAGQWSAAGNTHNGSPVADVGTAIPPANASTPTPIFTQFCAVGFDPVVTSHYVNLIYQAQGSPQYLASIIYGSWIENSSLTRTVVLSSGASSNLPNLLTWDFNTTASNINFGNGSFIANPTTAGGGWGAAMTKNTPGQRKARPSRVYAPNGGLGGGSTWLSAAQTAGTNASLVTGSGGHEIIMVSDAIAWVTSTLNSQGGGGGPQVPAANFSWTPTSPQQNESVQFTDTSTNAPTSWLWQFPEPGQGEAQWATSTQRNPTRTYTTTGTKTVILTATNTAGSSTSTKTLTVVAPGPPVANFTTTPTVGTVGQSVQFTDTSSGSPTSRSWEFGDGTTSTAQNPTKTYSAAGTYNVSLTAANGQGSHTVSRTFTVNQPSVVDVYQAENAQIVSSMYPGDPEGMHVVSEAPGYTGTGYMGYWGQPNEILRFSIPGATAGQYSVKWRYQKCDFDTPTSLQLWVNGAQVSVVQFSRTGTDWLGNTWIESPALTLNFQSGTNTVELRHVDQDWLYVDLDYMSVQSLTPPGNPPVASFTRTPTGAVETGVNISFTDTSTGSPTSWNWDFGDGTTATSQNPTKTYTGAGSYTITLQAVNQYGTASTTSTITVTSPPPVPQPPVAAFLASATQVTVGQVVTFTDQSTNAPNSWHWNFGDGVTTTAHNPTHAWTAPGTYSVTLIAANTDGSDDVSRQIIVIAPPVLEPGDPIPINRFEFTVMPKRGLSLAEEVNLRRVLSLFKPAATRLHVQPLGDAAIDDVPVIRVAADSEWWEVVGSVVTRPGTEWAYADPGDVTTPREQPRPPFASYQGEHWSYAGDVANIVAYADDVGQLRQNYFQRVAYADGTFFDFRPDLGCRWPQDAITELLASDGALVAHPLAIEHTSGKERWVDRVGPVRTRTSISTSGILPLYFNGVSIEDLAQRADSIFSVHRRQAGVPQRFWSTTERPKHDPIIECLEIRLRSSQRVNRVKFELAHFPQRAWCEAWSDATESWRPVWTSNIVDSIPSNLVNRVDSIDHLHPQHSLSGHWVEYDLTIDPTVASRWRLRLQRLATGTPPLNAAGKESDYSLGVRGFDLSYHIADRIDIPRLPVGEPVGTSVDPLGSRMLYSVRERLAPLAIDGDSSTAWLSEPQPTARAVVNFYADVRTSGGDGQIIDRWYLDPIKPGPTLNLYYSNDTALGRHPAVDTPLGIEKVEAEGLYTAIDDGISFDGAAPAYFLIDNSLIQFDHTRDWWIGVEVQPRFSGDNADSAIFSFDQFTCQFSDQSIVFATPGGGDTVLPLSWSDGQVIRLVVEYRASQRTISISAQVTYGDIESITQTLPMTLVGSIHTLRIGVDPGLSIPPDFVIRKLVINQSGLEDLNDFLSDPDGYVVKAVHAVVDTGRTNGAILRMHRNFVDPESNPFGLVGGPGNGFAALRWTPIPRDYRLQKGWLDIPPIKARFWKFEFSQLVIEPIEVRMPLHRAVQVFPQVAQSTHVVTREDPTIDIPAFDEFSRQWRTYSDTPSLTPEPDQTKIMPTALLYSSDPSGVQRLRSQSWSHGFTDWHVGSDRPRFLQEGVHTYDTIIYEQAEKIGFFVGLKEIRAARTSHRGVDNPMVINERLHDATRLAVNQWSHTAGNLWSGSSITNPAVVESAIIPTRTRISALQFAAQISDPVQLLPDDQFRSPRLTDYNWTDPQGWQQIGDAWIEYRTYDQQVLIRRAYLPPVTADPLDQGIVRDIVHPVFSTRGAPESILPSDFPGTVFYSMDFDAPNGTDPATLPHANFKSSSTGGYLTIQNNRLKSVYGTAAAYGAVNQFATTQLPTKDISAVFDVTVGDTSREHFVLLLWNHDFVAAGWVLRIEPSSNQIRLLTQSGGVMTAVAVAPVTMVSGETWRIRLEHRNNQVKVRTWTGLIEPTAWNISYNSSWVPATTYGVQFFFYGGNAARGATENPVYIDNLVLSDKWWDGTPPIPVVDAGGIQSPLVKTSPNGLIHAAARITAITDLTNQLWVQIVDEDDEVLVEEPIVAKRGDTVEWTASYFLGDYGKESFYLPEFGYRTIVDEPVRLVFAREDELVDQGTNPEPVVPGYLFRVRLIQKGPSTDTWMVDRLSLFDESLVWEFSVDGGNNYIPAYTIKNNPHGLLTFPRPGNALRWRLTAYRANLHLSAVQIRPQYVNHPTHRFSNPQRGPNVSVYDQWLPIQEDPEFKRWSRPVPQYWWLEGSSFNTNVPVDGFTYSNEYSDSYEREVIDNIRVTFSDSTSREVHYIRLIETALGVPVDTATITLL